MAVGFLRLIRFMYALSTEYGGSIRGERMGKGQLVIGKKAMGNRQMGNRQGVIGKWGSGKGGRL